jgi:adenylate cyclase class IV
MGRNIEIKARIESITALMPKVAAVATEGPFEIDQEDTFFHCANGRLKLRTLSEEHGELIFYSRANEAGPKESCYAIAPTAAPGLLREMLTRSCGQCGSVAKHRTVYLVGRTRVHLDRVRGLGDFLELEVVLREDEPPATGMLEARELMERFGVQPRHLIPDAYVDLIVPDDK